MPNISDTNYMQRALALAKLGQYTARPNPMVGCVIVNAEQVVGEGCHWQAGLAHAEVNALNQAREKARGATLYVTLEPCAHTGRTGPCIRAVIESGIKRVVVAVLDPNPLVQGKGVKALLEAGIEVEIGVKEKEAKILNRGFFSRMERRRPYVRAKVAMSLDGRIALPCGKSQWITSEKARENGHFERAQSCAILTGSQTVLKDDCRLTFRSHLPNIPEGIAFKQPKRLLIDSAHRCQPSCKIFHEPGETIVFTLEKSTQQKEVVLPPHQDKVSLNAVLDWCGQHEINSLLIEAGGKLTGALIQQNLVDEFLVYVAPKLLGHESMAMAFLPNNTLNVSEGHFESVEHLGKDLKITLPFTLYARAFYEHS